MDLGSDIMVDESNIEINGEDSTDNVAETEEFDVIYSCLRCNTKVNNSELSKLPEIKCICGFRVFTKVRPPIVKTVKAI
tara:strand:- start:1120 stop:1356 length:237 start_codon:yes stop_codon:yes gene_type:complete